ncbi:electron transfer flavoprotein subunit beta/FixA family protein [candidate division KSB1 bacterium]|nr:electron transfer flavoprotein subunit beta/FixA family protein [candidate division KSB1 bacterium]
MHIVVCVKQVPDTVEISIDPETHTLIREGVAATLNPFDAWALETAIRIRDERGGCVTALSMGPPQAETVLRQAIALGADDGVLLSDRAFAGADTLATSYTLARAVQALAPVDLVVCGKQAVDGDTAQVGPGIAAHLDWPQICFVKKIYATTSDSLTAERAAESGSEIVTSSLPCVLTVVKDTCRLRFPTLKQQMRARHAEIPIWGAREIGVDPEKCGLNGSPTWVDRIFAPPKRSGGRVVQGDVNALMAAFFEKMEENSLLDEGGGDG